jgi:hypothetical protein
LILIAGDLAALAVITLVGFATHGETGLQFVPRMLATFLPLSLGWFLCAPWLGLFDVRIAGSLKQLWRPPLAMLLAAPLAGILRGIVLGAAVLPLFVLVLGASAALGMLLWRAACAGFLPLIDRSG